MFRSSPGNNPSQGCFHAAMVAPWASRSDCRFLPPRPKENGLDRSAPEVPPSWVSRSRFCGGSRGRFRPQRRGRWFPGRAARDRRRVRLRETVSRTWCNSSSSRRQNSALVEPQQFRSRGEAAAAASYQERFMAVATWATPLSLAARISPRASRSNCRVRRSPPLEEGTFGSGDLGDDMSGRLPPG